MIYLPNCLQHSTARMFADDTNITVSGKSIKEAEVAVNAVAGQFAERHFAERHFAERHFAERTFCRRTFCRTDVLPNGHLPNGHFTERTVCRTDSLPKIEISSELYRFAYTRSKFL